MIVVLLSFPVGFSFVQLIKYTRRRLDNYRDDDRVVRCSCGLFFEAFAICISMPLFFAVMIPLMTVVYVFMMITFPLTKLVNCTCCKKSRAIEDYLKYKRTLNEVAKERRR